MSRIVFVANVVLACALLWMCAAALAESGGPPPGTCPLYPMPQCPAECDWSTGQGFCCCESQSNPGNCCQYKCFPVYCTGGATCSGYIGVNRVYRAGPTPGTCADPPGLCSYTGSCNP
jgi:hypothetical protein